jgi:hypothetical protein
MIETLLQAGYLEDWRYHTTLSGSPQGGVISPILSNIYLDKLDKFVERILLPKYIRGERGKISGHYRSIQKRMIRRRQVGDYTEAKRLRRELQTLPHGDPNDPDYRRLRYLRYADDFILGFAGPRAEAEQIKQRLGQFLHDTLKLELTQEKTLITHAQTEAARFLGYDIVTQHGNDQHDREGKRCINGRVGLRVPEAVLATRCTLYRQHDKPAHRPELLFESDYAIISRYQAEYRGLVHYYLLAYNIYRLGTLRWAMEQSLTRTLACKHKTRVNAILRQYRSTVDTAHGPMACLKVTVERGGDKKPLVAWFGGIPLRHQATAVLNDKTPLRFDGSRNDLLRRLLADTCELCGRQENCEVHHIRKLADLGVRGQRAKPAWVKRMAARRRKTLVVCHDCHVAIHSGGPTRQPVEA